LAKIFKDKYLVALVLGGGILLACTLWYGFGMDQAFFSYGAWLYKHYGLLPYIGTWDHAAPGIYLIHTLALYLFGESMFGMRFLDFWVQMANLLMLYFLTQKLYPNQTAGLLAGLLYSIYYFGLGVFDTAQREGFVFFLTLLSLLLALRWENKLWARAALVGLLLGFAFLTKTVFGAMAVVFGLWFLIEGWRKRPGRLWLELALFALAFLLPTAIIIFIYWRAHGLRELYDANIWYNYAVYAKLKYPFRYVYPEFWWLIIPRHVFTSQPLIFLLGSLAVLRLAAARDKKPGTGKPLALCLALLAVFLGLFLLQDKYNGYQFLPFLGLMCAFAGIGMALVAAWLKEQIRAGGFWAAVFYGLTLVVLLAERQDPVAYSLKHAFRSLDRAYADGMNTPADKVNAYMNYQAARGIARMLAPEDTIGFFGMSPLIPFLLKKPLPSRFCSIQQMIYRPVGGSITEQQLKWRKEYTEAVLKSRPDYFILADGELALPTDVQEQRFKPALVQDFPELNQFLTRNYTLVKRFGYTELYKLSAN